ncbi:MAG: DUF1326 domain-containing protein [Acidobacteria bacterium]|nr:DUF1326 domain-containing protein [Acidobacteriota bacterium]MBK7599362.1 DUF1326 domain-containing protein [Acidobacteriota bacterium]MBK8313546.1 DUF1326 domain-containing protein [Acidobacteriota bacterium]MBK9708241.1 DUF1326 domain-containing protein [Acidobacteriota bacterium]
MRKLTSLMTVGFAVMLLATAVQAQQIYGEYIESRNADVYTGHCFAMSELNLVGDQAILAWRISKGDWNGVKLDGLSVVGVARASGTLGNPYDNPLPARVVLIVDEKANVEQREALKSFAHEMGGDLFNNVVKTEFAPIRLDMEFNGEHPTSGSVEAGDLASIVTRSLTAKDHICGNEQTYYPPLAATTHSMPAVAVIDQYKGGGLGVSWTTREKRSAFIGHFSR